MKAVILLLVLLSLLANPETPQEKKPTGMNFLPAPIVEMIGQ